LAGSRQFNFLHLKRGNKYLGNPPKLGKMKIYKMAEIIYVYFTVVKSDSSIAELLKT